MIFLLWN